jgi:hypothetical protein
MISVPDDRAKHSEVRAEGSDRVLLNSWQKLLHISEGSHSLLQLTSDWNSTKGESPESTS